jgi:hypothetical protein
LTTHDHIKPITTAAINLQCCARRILPAFEQLAKLVTKEKFVAKSVSALNHVGHVSPLAEIVSFFHGQEQADPGSLRLAVNRTPAAWSMTTRRPHIRVPNKAQQSQIEWN